MVDYKDIDYKFNEEDALAVVKEYINDTYSKHYAWGNIQATEFIFDAKHGEGFCIGNIIKYAQRYGKKNGYDEADLLKIIHYAIMLLGRQLADNGDYDWH
tara:strand:+ start:190 stop:489 length:300 start_codon:yes stop_codon:yes gene_type:complete